MLTAVVIQYRTEQASMIEVRLPRGTDEEEHAVEVKDGPSPIAPEFKELAWGAGAFIVFAVLMRLVLFPRLKRGMEARYQSIRAGHEQAERIREQARGEVADYEAELAAVRAEVTTKIDAARRLLEDERQTQLGEVNARLAERRAAAAAEAEAAREAARGQVEQAVATVASRATELVVGKRPSDSVVNRAVAEAMGVGVGR